VPAVSLVYVGAGVFVAMVPVAGVRILRRLRGGGCLPVVAILTVGRVGRQGSQQ
jgi:hypothetical protein